MLNNLELTFDAEKIGLQTMQFAIHQGMPFYGYFMNKDYDLSLVLTSGWCMKYAINIEDLFKVQFISFHKHHKNL
jgi:hypothetical protein